MAFDAIDYKLLDLLQTNGRASQLELAQTVGLSQPAVAERIRKLEEQGAIIGYTALVNSRRLGKDITAFIGVFTNHPRYNYSFAQKIADIPEVLECHRVAGADSYLLKVKTENTSSLDELIARIRSIPGVERTQTTIAIASLKETTRVLPANAQEKPLLRGGRLSSRARGAFKTNLRRKKT
jgi:Lrp/AsnC family leucine-responsive transcriptional regulator